MGGVYAAANVAALATMMNLIYPIGSVLTFGVSTNPATLLGIGTWTAIAGKVIVGIDAGQTEFDTLDETGGAKTHTLILNELPALRYGGSTQLFDTGSSNNGLINSTTGGGAAHNNLQPYIVKYVWQRTA